MNNKLTTALLCALFVCAGSCGCSKSSEEGPGGNGSGGKVEGTVVKPAYSRSKILKNPLNGWVMYGSGTGDPSYWDTEFYVSELAQTVKVRDYASACYIRT